MKSKLLREHLLSIAIFGLVLIIAFGAVHVKYAYPRVTELATISNDFLMS